MVPALGPQLLEAVFHGNFLADFDADELATQLTLLSASAPFWYSTGYISVENDASEESYFAAALDRSFMGAFLRVFVFLPILIPFWQAIPISLLARALLPSG